VSHNNQSKHPKWCAEHSIKNRSIAACSVVFIHRKCRRSGNGALPFFGDWKNCHRSRIEVRPTPLLSYHAHTRWILIFDLGL